MTMASAKWSTPYSQLIDQLTKDAYRKFDETKDDVTVVAEHAADDIRNTIIDSVTPWGIRRQSQGRPIAGRVEDGDMINGVDTKVVENSRDRFIIEAGWVNGVTDYWKYQEGGSARIEAMHSIYKARVKAEEELKGKT